MDRLSTPITEALNSQTEQPEGMKSGPSSDPTVRVPQLRSLSKIKREKCATLDDGEGSVD